MLEVFEEQCKNCLYTKDRIVSPSRAKEVIKKCKEKQNYFICHKSSIEGGNVCCSNFYKKDGHNSQLIRIMGRCNGIKFVEQNKDDPKLLTHNEMNRRKKV